MILLNQVLHTDILFVCLFLEEFFAWLLCLPSQSYSGSLNALLFMLSVVSHTRPVHFSRE